MRMIDILLEAGDISDLRHQVISRIQKTEDTELLNKIYTVLESTGLKERISRAIDHDKDVKQYLDSIVNIILDTPGTYEDKYNFINAFPEGYVDIPLMLSGKRVHFEDLIKSKEKNAPIDFARKVFHSLKSVPGLAKGPGEFSLAVLSPRIDIFGAGDLKIDNRVIEVKASGGRLGSTGFLNHSDNATIIGNYLKITPGETLSLSKFNHLANEKLTPEQRRELGTKLFSSIFKDYPHVKAELNELISEFEKGNSISNDYIYTAYRAYQGPKGQEKFEGIMLMNFEIEELKYYSDVREMVKDIEGTSVQLIASNIQFAPRTIIPSLTLRRERIPKVNLPKKSDRSDEVDELLYDYANYLIRSAYIRDPKGELADQVHQYMLNLWSKGLAPTKIHSSTINAFPQLKKRQPKTITDIPAEPKPQIISQEPAQEPTEQPDTTLETLLRNAGLI